MSTGLHSSKGLLKRTLRKAAQTVGLHVGRFPATDSLQGHLKSFFRRTGINCVIDVGAHLGEYADEIREVGYRGRIVSFEPVRASYDALVHKAKAHRDWIIQHCALGSDDGEKEMNLYQGTVFNSFLASNHVGAERFGAALGLAAKERVAMRRLDRVFETCIAGIASPRVFLKMDTQGWDLEVLKGASGILDRLVGIQSELAVKHCYDGMTPYTAALEHYGSLGFQVTCIFPVARDTDGLQVMELDCVMLRVGAPARAAGAAEHERMGR
jgi:FkbM family methyltransferase